MHRIIAAFLLMAGCSTASVSHHSAVSSDQIMPDRLYFIDQSAPPLSVVRSAIDAAIAGDDAKLAYVISLVQHTDGEGGENYGEMLNELQSAVTPQRFQRVFATLDQNTRTMAASCMDVARHNREYFSRLNQT